MFLLEPRPGRSFYCFCYYYHGCCYCYCYYCYRCHYSTISLVLSSPPTTPVIITARRRRLARLFRRTQTRHPSLGRGETGSTSCTNPHPSARRGLAFVKHKVPLGQIFSDLVCIDAAVHRITSRPGTHDGSRRACAPLPLFG